MNNLRRNLETRSKKLPSKVQQTLFRMGIVRDDPSYVPQKAEILYAPAKEAVPRVEMPNDRLIEHGTAQKAEATILHLLADIEQNIRVPDLTPYLSPTYGDYQRCYRTHEFRIQEKTPIKRSHFRQVEAALQTIKNAQRKAEYFARLADLTKSIPIVDDEDITSAPTAVAEPSVFSQTGSKPAEENPPVLEKATLSPEAREKIQENCIFLSEQLDSLNSALSTEISMNGNKNEQERLTRQKKFVEGLRRQATQYIANSTEMDFPVTNPQVFRESFFSQTDNDVAFNALVVSEKLAKMLESSNGKITVRAETDPSRLYAFDNHAIIVVEVAA